MSSPEEDSPRADRLPVEHVQGIVERVSFHSDESGYTVLRFTVPGVRELVTVIGRFPEIHAGQRHYAWLVSLASMPNMVVSSTVSTRRKPNRPH